MDQRLSVALLLLGLTVLVDGQTVAAPFTGNITWNGCGTTKFCIGAPTGCDPASSGDCVFASTARDPVDSSGVSFELQGTSSGYIAIILATGGVSSGDAFECTQGGNGTVLFLRAYYNGSSLNPENVSNTVYNITGSAKDNIIKCTFIVKNLTTTNGTATILYNISLAVGNVTNGPSVKFQSSSAVNLLSVTPNASTPASPTSTTSSSTRSSSNSTMSFNTTSTNSTTPLNPTVSSSSNSAVPSATIGALTGSITSDQCGKTKICKAVPKNCNPADTGDCLFMSGKSTLGGVFLELSGLSSGYIATILSSDNITGDAYVCAQAQNKTLRFLRADYNRSALVEKSANDIDTIKGSLNGSILQCSFTAKNILNSRSKAAATPYYVILAVGNFTNDTLSAPDVRLRTDSKVDLGLSSASAPALTAVNGMLILVSVLIFGMY
nr:PREDICTED: putative ferric-chelate reductase 1 [Lepisosteus oculatus]